MLIHRAPTRLLQIVDKALSAFALGPGGSCLVGTLAEPRCPQADAARAMCPQAPRGPPSHWRCLCAAWREPTVTLNERFWCVTACQTLMWSVAEVESGVAWMVLPNWSVTRWPSLTSVIART
jgi:hypothetical protein